MKCRTRKTLKAVLNRKWEVVSSKRIDPTQTSGLRRQLLAEIRKRFRLLRGRVVKFVVVEDAFGLLEPKNYLQNVENCGGEGGTPGPCPTLTQKAVGKIRGAYAKFSQRYGRRGAIAIMAAMAVTMPLPGNIFGIIGVAEGARYAVGKFTGNSTFDDLLADVRKLADELDLPFDEEAFTGEYVKQVKMTENAFCPTGPGGGQDNSCGKGETLKISAKSWKEVYQLPADGVLRDVLGVGRAARFPATKIVNESVYVELQEAKRNDAGHMEGRYLRRRNIRGFWNAAEEVGELPDRKPTTNAGRFQFHSTPEKIKAFQDWLREQYAGTLTGKSEEELWRKFAEAGYRKGAGRAWDDVRGAEYKKTHPELYTKDRQESVRGFYQGTREEFLRSSFGRPETAEKLQLLASRSYSDLENVTDDMAVRMGRTLMDGLARGANPREIGQLLDDELDLGENRAETIARTEIIRAHAEGQLDSMEAMGVEEVGVAVEWSTAGDLRVCPSCSALDGIVLKTKESHGLIPRHPNAVLSGSTFAPYGECLEFIRSKYRGPCVVLTTAGRGRNRTTIGPNHPMMTRRGMVRAADLHKGDEVVYDSRRDHLDASAVQYKEVPRVEDVFETYFRVSGDTVVASPGSDFHGDREFCYGKVEAVFPTGSLLEVLDPDGIEEFRELDLVGADPDAQLVTALGSRQESGVSVLLPSSGRVGRKDLGHSLLPVHLRPLNKLGLRLGPDTDAHLQQTLTDHAAGDLEAPSDTDFRFSCEIPLPDGFQWKTVHSISFEEFDGWAFDCTTASSLYYSDGFVVSNCRCAFLPWLGEDTAKTKRTKSEIDDAVQESLDAEAEGRKEGFETSWVGADLEVDEDRPTGILEPTKNQEQIWEAIANSFCPTGEGGGVDPSCSPGGSSSSTPRTDSEESLSKTLKMLADLHGKNFGGNGMKHASVEDLVLKEGSFDNPAQLPDGVEMGEQKQCYMNAFQLATSDPDKYTYVEGYALISNDIPLPIQHAWVVDRDRNVIDNTWRTVGAAYLGVKMSDKFVLSQAAKTGVYGVFGGSHRGETRKLLAKGMPRSSRMTSNVFCPTGPGGGVDPTCSPGSSKSMAEQGSGRFVMTPVNPDGVDTQAAYRDSSGRYTAERQKLHDAIQEEILSKSTPVDRPTMYILGGGPGAGKTTLINSGRMGIPENHCMVAGDEVKLKIPEYARGIERRDGNVAPFVHEESTDIAGSAFREAVRSGRNVVLDGTGDSGLDKLSSKVAAMRVRGHEVVAHYVTIPTEVALERAAERQAKTGRGIPPSIIAENHAGVSRVFPQALAAGLFDRATLWDNSGHHDPVMVLSHERGVTTVHRPDLYQRFLDKGK